MTSIRHKQERGRSPEDDYLDAARETILAVGWRRTTLTDVAKRAGVSRMTIYRRWSDMEALLADLLVREWDALLGDALPGDALPGETRDRRTLVAGVVATVQALRDEPLLRKIIEVDPELLLPYLLERRGRNQDQILAVLAGAIRSAQEGGSVRSGDPGVLARTLLLALHGPLLSVRTMADADAGVETLDHELTVLVDRFLQP